MLSVSTTCMVSICSNQDSDFHPTPAKSQYTPVHATILHQHVASVPISCTLSFCLIRWFKTKNVCAKCVLSIEDPYGIDTDVVHTIKRPGLPPLFL